MIEDRKGALIMKNLNECKTPNPTTHLNGGFICTTHADIRKQQRGISNQLVDLVLKYGRYSYIKGQHCYRVSLDKFGLKKLQNNASIPTEISKLRKLYLVLSEENQIITCAYR